MLLHPFVLKIDVHYFSITLFINPSSLILQCSINAVYLSVRLAAYFVWTATSVLCVDEPKQCSQEPLLPTVTMIASSCINQQWTNMYGNTTLQSLSGGYVYAFSLHIYSLYLYSYTYRCPVLQFTVFPHFCFIFPLTIVLRENPYQVSIYSIINLP